MPVYLLSLFVSQLVPVHPISLSNVCASVLLALSIIWDTRACIYCLLTNMVCRYTLDGCCQCALASG